MRIALATCANLPDWEVDDRPLHAAFRDLGVKIARPVWDDPAVDWSAFDACLIRTTWDYQEKRDAYVAWVQLVAGLTQLFNPPDVVCWNTHKSYLRDLGDRGAPLIPTVWLNAGSHVDLKRELSERGWNRAFLKPLIGATARETLPFDVTPDGLAAANRHVARLLPHEDLMLQPFLEHVQTVGELSVIMIDGQVSHAVRKIPVPGDYRVQDDFGARDERITLPPEHLDLARRIVATVDADLLYARTDFLTDAAGRLRLSELELVEPSLLFRHCPEAAGRLATGLLRRLR
ncbi:MAG: hypothetical protein GY778_00800 [bacterium]|nr:hypothetical protein [bacterium]